MISNNENIGKLSLRKLAKIVGVEGKPQIIKHHLGQLEKSGLIKISPKDGSIKKVGRKTTDSKSPIYSLPVVGSANCGPATIFAEENIEKYLKISSKLLPRGKNTLFALIASGNSMNQTNVNGKNIEDGDFVIVDSQSTNYKDGDIVVSVLEGMANIKRFFRNEKSKMIALVSESTEDYLPIYISESDDLIINGKVVDIIKNIKLN